MANGIEESGVCVCLCVPVCVYFKEKIHVVSSVLELAM